MSKFLGDFLAGKKVYAAFNTTNSSGTPTTLTSGAVSILKDGALVTPSGGVTLTTDANGTGSHQLTVDMSVDTTTFAAGHDYKAYLSGSSAVGSTSVVGAIVAEWSIQNRAVVVDANGNVSTTPALSPVAQTGTAQAGAAGSITLANTASSTNNLYNGCLVRIVSGPGAGQARRITAYNGATFVATVDNNWVTNPTNASTYAVIMDEGSALNSSLQPIAASVAGNVAGTVGSVTGSVGSVTGAVTVGTNNDKAGYGLSSAAITAIANAVFSGVGVTSTVTAGTSTTVFTVAPGLPSTIIGSGCLMTTGTATNVGTELLVTAYNSVSGQVTVSGGYASTPAANDTCVFVGRLQ